MKPKDEDDTTAATVAFRGLPDRIKYEDMVIEVPASDAQDPEMGRNTDQDFTLRNLG